MIQLRKTYFMWLCSALFCFGVAVSCRSSKTMHYPEAIDYNDTSTAVRAAEKKLKKPVFDTAADPTLPVKK